MRQSETMLGLLPNWEDKPNTKKCLIYFPVNVATYVEIINILTYENYLLI